MVRRETVGGRVRLWTLLPVPGTGMSGSVAGSILGGEFPLEEVVELGEMVV